jgi:hypothetical protein
MYKFNPNWLSIFDSLGVKLGKLGRQTDALGRQIVHSRASNCRTNNINNNIINNEKSYPQAKAWDGLSDTANDVSPLLKEFIKKNNMVK